MSLELLIQLVGGFDVLGEILVGDVVVAHLAGEVLVVGAHVHETMAGKVEEDGLRLAGLLAFEGLVDGRGDGVAGLGSGDDPLGPGEEDAGLERVKLLDVNGFHEPVLHQLRHDDTGPVIAESSGVDGGGLEGVAKGVHREERGEAGLVAEVIFELTPGKFRA